MERPAELEATHARFRRGGTTLVVHRDWQAALPVEAMLAGAPRRAWGRPLAHDLVGRASIDVLDTDAGPIVAKELRRGGLIGGLLRRTFLDPRRPLREAAVAEALRRAGVDTPPVVAVRVRRAGIGWRIETATARRGDARDLLDVLAARGPVGPPALAPALGRTLRRLHDLGLRHRDLQVKNLLVPRALLDGDGAAALVVIDLDRCALGSPLGEGERARSLARLGRSLVKHGFGGPAAAWRSRAVVRAYSGVADGAPAARAEGAAGAAPAGRPGGGRPTGDDARARAAARALWRASRARLARAVRWHARFWPAARGGADRPGAHRASR